MSRMSACICMDLHMFNFSTSCCIIIYTASREKKSRLHFNLSCILRALSMHCSFSFFFLWLPRNQRCISEEHKGKDYVNLNEFSHRQLIYISKCIWRTCFHYLSPQQGEKKRKTRTDLHEWRVVSEHVQSHSVPNPACWLRAQSPSLCIHNNIRIQYIHIHTPTSLWLS